MSWPKYSQTETARPKCPVTETAQTETAQTQSTQTKTARLNQPDRIGQTEKSCSDNV